MIGLVFRKLFGNFNDRQLKKINPLVGRTNALEAEYSKLSDDALRAKTAEFKARLAKGETLDDLLPEAFAAMREACKRVLKMRHYDVQLIGGAALHKGMIAEMTTGEGKTLVATLAAYLNALEGKGVHVITVNDYLAGRDRAWMGPAYEFLGLTVGSIQHSTPMRQRREMYACDITYGTNNEFGFDYLRDNMVVHIQQKVQRDFNYAIVDEVDSILVDEARTPLIISGPSDESTDLYYKINSLIPTLAEADYQVEEKTRTIALTDTGVQRAEKYLAVENLYDPHNVELVHHVSQALRAHKLFKKDVDYVVQNGEVIIVDEFTGRMLPGRRFSDGLHQALEAKEGVTIESENQTLASVTFQNYFRMYKKLSGMTGTAATEAQEFHEIYKLGVLTIPTNKPMRRKNHADAVYRTEREKFVAVAEEIVEMNKLGRPCLVGTISIEKSEHVSRMLEKMNIPHTVLNAKYHEREAEIIKLAGQRSAVTIATNMAGRGTDIVLGEGVADIGGLHVIGTERHESRRIDNQLRGRTGRQGDPGSSQFFLSLEDDLMRIFGSDRIAGVMQRLGMQEGEAIQHGMVSKSIETAQARVESRNFDIRKELLKYDDIMNQQRIAIYTERRRVLEGEDLKSYYLEAFEDIIGDAAQGLEKAARMSDDDQNAAQKQSVADYLKSIFPQLPETEELADADLFKEKFYERVKSAYEEKEQAFTPQILRRIERMILLEVIDTKWKDHLRGMDELREGIGLRAYGQKDPIVEFRREGFHMFEEITRKIKEDAVSFILRAQPMKAEEAVIEAIPDPTQNLNFVHPSAMTLSDTMRQAPQAPGPRASAPTGAMPQGLPLPGRRQQPEGLPLPAAAPEPLRRDEEKVGRNDVCPCGSGKKYKKCHGA
ncbi:MAG: preprotein translocase subunit SecA [Candidatus Omnitrophica bacterium]|nr:preprotein translocase subunit SecA [Candidatus Omnitrophota bacterium]